VREITLERGPISAYCGPSLVLPLLLTLFGLVLALLLCLCPDVLCSSLFVGASSTVSILLDLRINIACAFVGGSGARRLLFLLILRSIVELFDGYAPVVAVWKPELDDCARFLSGGLLFCTGCVVVVVVVCGVGSAIAWICQCVQIVNQT